MNKSILTIGIVLSLGTVGCAGFGVQQGSAVTAHLHQERGVDGLWIATEATPYQGTDDTPRYADQTLGGLWNSDAEGADPALQTESNYGRGLGDLWNSSSVTRSWDINSGAEPAPAGALFSGSAAARNW